MKTNKLNVCLIKSGHTAFDEIVKPGAKAHPIEEVGIFYTERSHANPPDWVKDFFIDALDGIASIFTASARGVLLVQIGKAKSSRVFAIIFGHGRHLLRNDVIEESFGLRVVLNTVIKDSLRSIDKTTLGSTPKLSREQMSREGEAASFGIDIEQDLINAVTGRSKDPRLGKTISGRDSLSMSAKVDISNIKAFLPIILERHESEDYKFNFEWIDQIIAVRNQKILAKLNAWLTSRLGAQELDRIWMAPPTIVDWVDVKGFRYGRRKRACLHLDLAVSDFLATLDDDEIELNLLKQRTVYAISAKSDDVADSWSVYKCLYAEVHIDKEMYVLNNGKWYKISSTFTQRVLSDFNNLPESSITLPEYNHLDEGAYNRALPKSVPNSCCMDQKLIPYGGGHNAIEFCDLLTADNQLVHVKRYSGSAQFSHLFNQGVVSGELFVGDIEFRRLLNKKLPENHKLSNAVTRPNPLEYEVVFAIISRSMKPLDIPFFSKVGLRNARRRLAGYGYKVTKKKILNLKAIEQQ